MSFSVLSPKGHAQALAALSSTGGAAALMPRPGRSGANDRLTGWLALIVKARVSILKVLTSAAPFTSLPIQRRFGDVNKYGFEMIKRSVETC